MLSRLLPAMMYISELRSLVVPKMLLLYLSVGFSQLLVSALGRVEGLLLVERVLDIWLVVCLVRLVCPLASTLAAAEGRVREDRVCCGLAEAEKS